MGREIPVYTIESLTSTDAAAKEVDLFRFEYFAQDIEHLKTPHRHHFYTFILVTEGGGSHSIDFKNYELTEGRLFLIAPGQVHAWHELHDVKGFVLLFTDSFMALSKGRNLLSSWPLFRAHLPCLIDLKESEKKNWFEEFEFMEQEFMHPDEYTRDALFYSISALLVRASRLMRSGKNKNPLTAPDFLFTFQELIERNFLTLKSPQDYASKLNITPNYLNALCKKKSGKSAGELIRQRIILEAKRLLVYTNLSVSEIALKLGFIDNSYFGRYFRKYVHTTPERFRKNSFPIQGK